MEDNVIAACYRWTADEYVASYELHQQMASQGAVARQRAHSPGGWAILAVLLVPLWGVLAIIALREPGVGTNDILLLVLVIVSAAFLLLRKRLGRPDPRADFAQRKDSDQQVCYTFTEEGLAIRTDTASIDLAWEALSMVARGSRGFLFYRDEYTFHWAPFHAFSAGDTEVLEDVVRRRAARVVEL